MKQRMKLIAAVIAVFALLSPVVMADDNALEIVQSRVDDANSMFIHLISKAQEEAEVLKDTYKSGQISNGQYRSGVAAIATTLVTTTNSISRETIQFAADLGIRVKCERIVVDIGFMKISVDPLIICDD